MSELTSKYIRLKICQLVFTLLLSSLTGTASAQIESLREFVRTSKGILKIEEDSKTIGDLPAEFKSLTLNKKLIFRYVNNAGEFVSIEKYFPLKRPNLIIFFIGSEAVSCIGQFFIVDVSNKKPLITERFGNCSNNPQIDYRNQTLTLTFPQGATNDYYKTGDKKVWQYYNGKLRRLK